MGIQSIIRPIPKLSLLIKAPAEQGLGRIISEPAGSQTLLGLRPGTHSAEGIGGLNNTWAYFLGGTSILIVVEVALDLVEQINAHLVMKKGTTWVANMSRNAVALS